MKPLWLVKHGLYWTEGGPTAVYDLKKDAIRDIRAEGYKHEKETDLYLNKETACWYSIEQINYNTLR